MMFRRILVALSAVALLTLGASSVLAQAPAQHRSVTVFAAASMKNALDEVNGAFSRQSGIKVVASYAATSALVRQIEQGAPADVFVSADVAWMDYAITNKLVRPDTQVGLLGNRLVLIAPADSELTEVELDKGANLLELLDGARLLTGDVKAVPAGRYARAALESLGLWPSVEKRLAMTENVRVALALVARGEAPLGIVYETDAKVEPKVKIVGVFPAGSHPPVTYPVAATMQAKADAAPYLSFLRSRAAKAVFERYGFSFLIEPAYQAAPRPRTSQ